MATSPFLQEKVPRAPVLPTQIAVLGSTHMDFIAYLDRFPQPGETVTGRSFSTSPGGKGANQAVAAARLGAASHLISKVGADFVGDTLLENLRKEHVSTGNVTKDPRDSTGVALIYVNSSGENMIAVAPGVDHLVEPSDFDGAGGSLVESKVIVSQLELPLETVGYAMTWGRRAGKLTLLNPAPAMPLHTEVLESVDVLTPNWVELEALTGKNCVTDRDIEDSAESLIGKGVKYVIVTLGGRGAMIVTGSEHLVIPGYRVQVVDTVGAGDAFNGALAVALSIGEKIIEAVQFANLVGALKVTKRGAQTGLPTLQHVMKSSKAKNLRGILGLKYYSRLMRYL